MAAKMYAHHMEPTPAVIFRANAVLNRVIGLVRENWSATLTGRAAFLCMMCGCGM
jgi:hypothetical protein